MQFADVAPALLEKVVSKLPHHRKLSFIPMVAGWKEVKRVALGRQLHAMPRRAAMEQWERVDLHPAWLEHTLDLAETFVEIEQMLECFRMDGKVEVIAPKGQLANILIHKFTHLGSAFHSWLVAGLCNLPKLTQGRTQMIDLIEMQNLKVARSRE